MRQVKRDPRKTRNAGGFPLYLRIFNAFMSARNPNFRSYGNNRQADMTYTTLKGTSKHARLSSRA
jgi:hypothetical protein